MRNVRQTATFGETATIKHLVTGDTFLDRSHHTDEIHTQLRLRSSIMGNRPNAIKTSAKDMP